MQWGHNFNADREPPPPAAIDERAVLPKKSASCRSGCKTTRPGAVLWGHEDVTIRNELRGFTKMAYVADLLTDIGANPSRSTNGAGQQEQGGLQPPGQV